MVWGVAVSVVLHLLLIFGYRLSAPKALPELPPKETMTVWLMQPKPPAPAPVTANIAPPPKPAQPVRKPKETPARAAASPSAPATTAPATNAAAETPTPQPVTPPTPASAPASNATDPLYPPQQQQQQQQSRQFDMNAALKTARKVANEKDPARAGLPVAQLDDHPLYPEQNTNELATKIKGAKRESCLNQPGNLLTPLFWLLEKKDHGCKL